MNGRATPTLFSSLLESCVSFRFYARIVETPLGRAFTYLTLLAVLSAVAFTVFVYHVILPRLNEASSKLPTITVKNGTVSVEIADGAPASGTLYADPERVLRIDLALDSEKEILREATGYDYTLVITKYTLILKKRSGQVLSRSLPYGFSLTIFKNRLQAFIEEWLWWIVALVFLFSFAFFWVLKLATAFALTIPGVICWGTLRRDLTYGKLMVLCIYALTPAMFLGMLLLWLNAQFLLPAGLLKYQWVIYLAVSLEYLVGGLVAIAPPQPVRNVNDKTLTERMF